VPTLPLSAAWLQYNVVGNALMAMFGGGVGPGQLARAANRVVKAAREQGGLEYVMPYELSSHGLSWSERQHLSNRMMTGANDAPLGRAVEYATSGERSRLGKVVEASYGVNEFVDNVGRSAVYLDRLERTMPAVPASILDGNGNLIPESMMTDAQRSTLADYQTRAADTHNKAIRATLNIMGDFTRLTWWERRYIKRAIPFYPWLRHQARMAMRMPFTNPLRFAFLHTLDERFSEQDDSNLGRLMGSVIPWGDDGMAISLAPFSPFSGGLTPFGTDMGSVDNTASTALDINSAYFALAPDIKLLNEFVTGGQGLGSYSRPQDQYGTGRGGQREDTSPLMRIAGGDITGGVGETLYRATRQQPQVRGIADIVTGNQPRYGSGDVIDFADPRPGSLAYQLYRAARLGPTPQQIDYVADEARRRDILGE